MTGDSMGDGRPSLRGLAGRDGAPLVSDAALAEELFFMFARFEHLDAAQARHRLAGCSSDATIMAARAKAVEKGVARAPVLERLYSKAVARAPLGCCYSITWTALPAAPALARLARHLRRL